MDLTSNYTAPLGLPNGQVLPARGSVAVLTEDWAAMKDHRVVKAWLAEKKIALAAEPVQPAAESPKPVALDSLSDDELRIFLKDREVNADGRWGRDKLLAEAKKVQVPA